MDTPVAQNCELMVAVPATLLYRLVMTAKGYTRFRNGGYVSPDRVQREALEILDSVGFETHHESMLTWDYKSNMWTVVPDLLTPARYSGKM